MKKIGLFLIIVTVLVSCGTEGTSSCTNDSFDRKAMLENWANNIIIPSFENYDALVSTLKTDVTTFSTTPNQNNLAQARSSWLLAYKAWQQVAMFQIGEAEVIRLKEYSNSYPVDAVGVESNISSEVYDLALSTQINRQGFPALDYLLNGLKDTDAEIITTFSATSYKNYANAVVDRLKLMSTAVVTDWKTNYAAIFIANDCSSSTSSVDKLVNDFIFNFEKNIRVSKIGNPIGFFTNTPIPEAVEAFYKKDVSKELFLTAVNTSKDFFNGKHFNSNTEGKSLKSYLIELQVEAGGKNLSDYIVEKFDKVLTSANALDANFYAQIISDRAVFIALRENDLHPLLEVMKTNMLSALDIKADYNDSDGD
ncbi:imelysin family protein [Flavicella sediminum]|uniref:imelysin family protein n=1 Tax=Flavicella sediminum TaxID=2585141 RepID=UPI001123697C|nr:imelysin family protein [Flavicella sediminum]